MTPDQIDALAALAGVAFLVLFLIAATVQRDRAIEKLGDVEYELEIARRNIARIAESHQKLCEELETEERFGFGEYAEEARQG